jgi:glycosyltransferase involved in cell wall biosynthesis
MRTEHSNPIDQRHERGSVCVVIAAHKGQEEQLRRCQASVEQNTPPGTSVLTTGATAAAVNRLLEQLAPADVVVLSEPCLVAERWLERLARAAMAESGTASASALSDFGRPLSLHGQRARGGDAQGLAVNRAASEPVLPRLNQAVGPCIYVSRAAIELVGSLDESLELRWALEIDFAQRCLLSGLAHVAADDVVVRNLAHRAPESELPTRLRERYPYLARPPVVAASGVLAHVLRALSPPRPRLWVTVDARALDGVMTGTQVHILELIRALAETGALRLRLLVREDRIDQRALELLRGLPETEILPEADVDDSTPMSTVLHRPQQTFAAEDVALGLRLGERLVLSQLDLIAYRNPAYFPDPGAWHAYCRASRHGMAAAERVVVFSDHTRRELLRDSLVEQERIAIIPPGLDHQIAHEPTPPPAIGRVLGEADAHEAQQPQYLLCLGTDFRHKNRLFALRLLAALQQRKAWNGRLVFAGTHVAHGSSRADEHSFLEAQPQLREDVIDLGSVTEEEKDWLIQNAAAVVYPSAYEGFGLVPFESALRGVPCMFAAQSSLAEIVPVEAAAIVPWDELQSAEAAYVLIADPVARSQQVQALAQIANGLTWARTASAMVETYRAAAASPLRVSATLSRDAVERERVLTAAFDDAVEQLIAEREHETLSYDELKAEIGPGQSLIGPRGTLPENLQGALLALSARPALSRPLFGALASLFVAMRAPARVIRRMRRRDR